LNDLISFLFYFGRQNFQNCWADIVWTNDLFILIFINAISYAFLFLMSSKSWKHKKKHNIMHKYTTFNSFPLCKNYQANQELELTSVPYYLIFLKNQLCLLFFFWIKVFFLVNFWDTLNQIREFHNVLEKIFTFFWKLVFTQRLW